MAYKAEKAHSGSFELRYEISIVLYCIVFIHLYSASHSLSLSEALSTTAIDTVSEFARRSATISEGLAQGPYTAARAGFEPTTLRSNGVVSTNTPPCPIATIYI